MELYKTPRLIVTLTCLLLFLSACSSVRYRDSAPRAEINVASIPDAVPRVEPRTSAGNPDSYTVLGKTYYVKDSSEGYVERGIASWYGTKFHGNSTSNGETYSMYKMTAAHKTLPIPTYVEVRNLKNGKRVIVRVNDRGPFHHNRIIDLSYVAAKKLGIAADGTGLVEVRSIDPRNWRPGTRTARSFITNHQKPVVNAHSDLFIQAGAFASKHNAMQLQQKLVALLPQRNVQLAYIDQDKLYRVRIGPLATVNEADQIAQLISDNGYPTPHVVVD